MNCFKAYDIRGRVPEKMNEDIAYRIGRVYATSVKSRQFNLRSSNTEPILRLNVESRGDYPLMQQKTSKILPIVDKAGS